MEYPSDLRLFYKSFVEYCNKTKLDIGSNKFKKYAANFNSLEDEKIEITFCTCTIDDDWIEAIEYGLKFCKKAIDEQRQFIRNDGDVLPLEKIRKLGKASIEDLGKHSNYITHLPSEDSVASVMPDKLLLIRKESDFTVYENRVVYAALVYIRDFVTNRLSLIKEKTNTYQGVANIKKVLTVGNRSINFSINLDEIRKYDPVRTEKNECKDLIDRLDAILSEVLLLLKTDLMRECEKVDLVRRPITKTNVLKMNRNFMETLAMFDYIAGYDKPGYQIFEHTKTFSPLALDAVNNYTEIILLYSFITYALTNELNGDLKVCYEEELKQLQIDEDNKLLEKLRSLHAKVKMSEKTMEEYLLDFEAGYRILEKRVEEFEKEKQELIEQHKKELVELQSKLLKEKEEEIYQLNLDQAHEIEFYKAIYEERLTEQRLYYENKLEEQKNAYETKLEEQKNAYEDKLKEQELSYENQLLEQKTYYEELIVTKTKELEDKLSTIESEHNQVMNEQKDYYENTICLLKEDYEGQISNQKENYENEIAVLHDDVDKHIAELNEKTSEFKATIDSKTNDFNETLSKNNEKCAFELENVRTSLNNKINEVLQSSDAEKTAMKEAFEGKIKELNGRYDDLEKASRVTISNLENDLKQIKEQYDEINKEITLLRAKNGELPNTEQGLSKEDLKQLEKTVQAVELYYVKAVSDSKKAMKKKIKNVKDKDEIDRAISNNKNKTLIDEQNKKERNLDENLIKAKKEREDLEKKAIEDAKTKSDGENIDKNQSVNDAVDGNSNEENFEKTEYVNANNNDCSPDNEEKNVAEDLNGGVQEFDESESSEAIAIEYSVEGKFEENIADENKNVGEGE